MGYGKLIRFGSTESLPSVTDEKPRRRRLLLLGSVAILFLLLSAVSAVVLVYRSQHATHVKMLRIPKPTQAISQTCDLTQYPSLCIVSLVEFPGATQATRPELVHISVNMTLHHVGNAFYAANAITNLDMEPLFHSAYRDCLELLDSSIDHLSKSLAFVAPTVQQAELGDDEGSQEDVLTWLSAALTNQDTCSDGLDDVADGPMKEHLTDKIKDLSQLVSNALAIVALSKSDDLTTIPIINKRRKLLSLHSPPAIGDRVIVDGFPSWVEKRDRRLLESPVSEIQADFVVSKTSNSSDTYKTIGEAVRAAPKKSKRRIIIYVMAGKYDENVKIGTKKTNIMIIGDGRGRTVVASSKSVHDKLTTFRTATFAATGAGFIARDISFENFAGPKKHQAVALRIGADHSVVFHCNIIGYQDTLYVHSQRQFYRECNIYGTVDFVFGNAAVVLQNCSLYARKPMEKQKCTVTAQNRKDPNQNTGISLHNCQILPAHDLVPVMDKYPTYLGRPWKKYSRVVVILSYIGQHVDPAGWLKWNGKFALNTLYYGEYMNYGPGAGVDKRVKWPGFRIITLPEEADKFTVKKFISGSSWLPSTGVAFIYGLSD